jgi:hypothetical protein
MPQEGENGVPVKPNTFRHDGYNQSQCRGELSGQTYQAKANAAGNQTAH